MSLPKSISPCPIVDAIFEIRFSTSIPSSAVFGLVYNALRSDFPQFENLPIMQLPDNIRTSDPNFKFKPYHRAVNDGFVLQVGPDVISISSHPEYKGWGVFSEKILKVIEAVENINLISEVKRIGIRYINFFELNVFEQIDLNLSLGDQNIVANNTIVRTSFPEDDFNSGLQIANNAVNGTTQGSIIDIDTVIENNLGDFLQKKSDVINKGHDIEKKLFFSLLKEDFLSTLNPEY